MDEKLRGVIGGCPHCSGDHPMHGECPAAPGGWADPDGGFLTVHHRDTRIEALRAASRVVAGAIHGREVHLLNEVGAEMDVPTMTMKVAEQFARWLETGER